MPGDDHDRPRAAISSASSAAMRTSGLPPISASNLFGPPMRVERPAARMIAATRVASLRRARSRGCGRVTISISSPPTPMPVMSSRVTGMPASSRISTQSKPFSFGRARAARRAEHRSCRSTAPISIRLPGSTGMPKCSIAPARRLDRGRDHVAPVGDGRRAEHDDKFGAVAQHSAMAPLRARALRAARASRPRSRRPAGARRSCVIFKVLSMTFSDKPGKQGRNDPDLPDPIRRDANERLCRSRDLQRRRQALFGHREGNDLHGRRSSRRRPPA